MKNNYADAIRMTGIWNVYLYNLSLILSPFKRHVKVLIKSTIN